MFLRNAEFTRLKIVEQLGERRSTLLVDASLFSNTFHSGDQLMQQEQSVLLDVAVFHSLKRIPISTGMFSKADKAVFPDGDAVAVKFDFKGSFGFQSLAVMSHEHRILKFIGKHTNIVKTIGLVHLGDMFVHVMNYESGLNLANFFKKKLSITSLNEFQGLVNGVASGLNFLFSKGVLHNHLVADNIIFKDKSPVIIGFTFACRIESAKVEIENVLQKFENQQHFANELFKGSKVSCASDVYAYGYLLQLILKFSMYELDDTMETRLNCIVGHCLKRNPGERLPHIFLSDRLKAILSL